MEFPANLFYTDDEWIRFEDQEAVVGITDYAQDQLGDIVYVELPAVGSAVTLGEPFGVIESVKAVADLVAPAAGVVVAINEELADAPELVNESPYERGWMLRLRLQEPDGRQTLMDANRYRATRPEPIEEGA